MYTGLLATLLDPRLKRMRLWPDDIQEETIQFCRDELNNLINSTSSTLSESIQSNTPRSGNRYLDNIFDDDEYLANNSNNELDRYLDITKTPIAIRNTDPLVWWKTREKEFLFLSQLARKYLSIPATSVPSERLFSDAGNTISAKRTSLSSSLVSQMLFLKRNSHIFNIS